MRAKMSRAEVIQIGYHKNIRCRNVGALQYIVRASSDDNTGGFLFKSVFCMYILRIS